MMEGPQQESVRVDEADAFSKVLKRTVVRSAGDQTQVCLCAHEIFNKNLPNLQFVFRFLMERYHDFTTHKPTENTIFK